MKRLVTLLGIVLVSATAVTVPMSAPASAGTIEVRDGNDTRGPLDLRSVTVRHRSRLADRIELEAIRPFGTSQIDGEIGWFAVALPESVVYLYFDNGRYRGVGVTRSGGYGGTFQVKRLNGRTLAMTFRGSEADRGTYEFVGASVWKGSPCSAQHACVDVAPNRGAILHDLEAPTIKCCNTPSFGGTDLQSYGASDSDLTIPVSFSLKDDRGGSGIDRWRLERRAYSGGGWEATAQGKALSPTVTDSVIQGETYDYRVVAFDRQGNRTISETRGFVAPFDDSSSAIQYAGTWTTVADSGALLASRREGSTESTLTVQVRGRNACWLMGPTAPGTTATADYLVEDVDGIAPSYGGTATAWDTANRICASILGEDKIRDWTVTFTVTSATPFPFDGIVGLQFPN